MQDPARVAEVEVDPPQIPATPDGTRIRGIQGIQNLGNNDAFLHKYEKVHYQDLIKGFRRSDSSQDTRKSEKMRFI